MPRDSNGRDNPASLLYMCAGGGVFLKLVQPEKCSPLHHPVRQGIIRYL